MARQVDEGPERYQTCLDQSTVDNVLDTLDCYASLLIVRIAARRSKSQIFPCLCNIGRNNDFADPPFRFLEHLQLFIRRQACVKG